MDLELLQGQIIDRVESYGANRKAAIQDAIEGGRLLLMARGRLNHGDYQPFVERCGLKARTARRWTTVAETHLESGHVAVLGGLECTARLWRTLAKGREASAVTALLKRSVTFDWEELAQRLPVDDDVRNFYSEMVELAAMELGLEKACNELEEANAELFARIATLEAVREP